MPYSDTAHKDHEERLHSACTADDPSQPHKHQHPEDMLDGRQVHSQNCAQLGFLQTDKTNKNITFVPQLLTCSCEFTVQS